MRIKLFVVAILVVVGSFGCANRAQQPQQPQQPVASPQVERSIAVEEGSASDYTVRAGHAVVEAAQGTAEAAEDAYDWASEKKRQAKAWLHEVTEEDKE